jgi:hypothetical protein
MPTNRRRRPQPQREPGGGSRLSPAIREILSEGMDFFGDLSYLEPIPKDRWGKIQRNLWVHIKGYFRPCEYDPPSWTPDARLDFLRGEWKKHKTEVLKWHIERWRDGSRPWGWWCFDAVNEIGETYPADGEDGDERRKLRAAAVLIRHGLLSREEEFLIKARDAQVAALMTGEPDLGGG